MAPEVVIRVIRGTAWDSKLIEWRTRSRWSHIEACYPPETYPTLHFNPYLTFGAQLKGGVKYRWTADSCYDGVSDIEAWNIPCSQEQHDIFWKFLNDQDGKPYDWRAIFAFELGERDWTTPDSWICSELQAAALKISGIWNPKGDVHIQRIDPNILYLIMTSLPGANLRPVVDN